MLWCLGRLTFGLRKLNWELVNGREESRAHPPSPGHTVPANVSILASFVKETVAVFCVVCGPSDPGQPHLHQDNIWC